MNSTGVNVECTRVNIYLPVQMLNRIKGNDPKANVSLEVRRLVHAALVSEGR